MKKVLVLTASPNGAKSVSRQLTEKIITQLKAKHGPVEVISHDLAQDPPPHWSGLNAAASFTPVEARTAEMKKSLNLSDRYLGELKSADFIVIGTPMWNFNMPSTLKAWIDHIVRAGETFQFTPTGLKGLMQGKKVYLALSSGSVFSEGSFKSYDHLEPHLKAALGFIGITDFTTVRAEGTNDPANSAQALQKAEAQIQSLV